jgi:toxin-antitoxin system PIN domain toxin
VFVVDTNVLVYAANADDQAHEPCRKALESWRRQQGAWYITWGIVYEFLRVATHPKVLRKPWTVQKAWKFIEVLVASPGLDILQETERHEVVVKEIFQDIPHLSGNIIHDTHTAALMQEHGIRRIYTRDTDFHRFPFLQVIDPLQVSS